MPKYPINIERSTIHSEHRADIFFLCWVGTGQNLPITPQQIQQALGGDTIKQFASKMGINADQASKQISDMLPKVVNKLTPNGQVLQGDLTSKGMDLLKSLMK